MRDNHRDGAPIATPSPATAPRMRRRVIFIPQLVLKRPASARLCQLTKPQAGRPASFLDFRPLQGFKAAPILGKSFFSTRRPVPERLEVNARQRDAPSGANMFGRPSS